MYLAQIPNSHFILACLNYLLIGVPLTDLRYCLHCYSIYQNYLSEAISENRQRIIAVNHLENNIVTTTLFVLTKKSYFLSDFHNILPKCRASYVVSEKWHGAGEKGHGAREKGHGAAPCSNWLWKRLESEKTRLDKK